MLLDLWGANFSLNAWQAGLQMANTAATIKLVPDSDVALDSRHRSVAFDCTPTGTYSSPGIGMSGGQIGAQSGQVERVDLTDRTSTGPSGYHFYFDYVNNSIRFFVGASGAVDTEVGNGTTVSTVTVRATFIIQA